MYHVGQDVGIRQAGSNGQHPFRSKVSTHVGRFSKLGSPFRILSYKGAVLYWGPKKGPDLEN